MEKLIFKYLSGKADEEETKKIRQWILESEENTRFFAKIKNIYVVASMKDDKASDEDSSLFIAKLRRHELRKKIMRMAARGAAAIILFLIVLAVYQHQQDSFRKEMSYVSSQQIAYNQYFTPSGVKGKIILPDSTVVWLNSSSSISYPSKFIGKTKNINFDGEGYFEVKKDPDHPMKITLDNGMSLYVKGTSFNLSSYENDNSVSILLLSGKVSLMNRDSKEFFDIEPNQKISIDKKSNKISVVTPEDVMPTVGWKKGWLIFEETEMPEIIKKMKRWYGVDIIVKDSSIMTKTLTAKFREESLSQVLEMMHRISLINYSLKDSTAILNSYN